MEKTMARLQAEIAQLNEKKTLRYYREFPTEKGLLGSATRALKRAVRKCARFLVEPIVQEQNEYNQVNVQIAEKLVEIVSMQQNEIDIQQGQIALLQKIVDSHKTHNAKDLQQVGQRLGALEMSVLANVRMFLDKEGANLLRTHMANFLPEDLMGEPIESTEKASQDTYETIDYFDFEDHFRGPQELIKERQKIYLPYFQGCENVVDIGCGRGEFLELLRDEGISAQGVEIHPRFVEYCTMIKGLNVISQDMLTHLESQPDESLGGITAFQVIEHITTQELIALCKLAYRKLKKGAYMLMETPNAMSLLIYTNSFYIDPSHNKPVHPYTAQYILEKAGFTKVELFFPEASREESPLPCLMIPGEDLNEYNIKLQRLYEKVYISQDCATIARK